MATMNESLFNTPSAKRALKLHEARIAAAENVRKRKGLDMSFEKKLATAICLENTRRQIRTMEAFNGSATQPSNIGQYKRFAMDMTATLIPNLIAPDLVSVQALENRVGMINILEYQYGSDKGAAKNGQVFASPLAYQGMNTEYTASTVTETFVEAGAATDAAGNYIPNWTPVINAFNMKQNKAIEIVDGAFKKEDIADGDTIVYRYDNETVPVEAPTMKLDIRSLPVETHSRKLKALWSFDAQYELYKEYGSDLQTMLATQAVAEIQQEIDNEITFDLYKYANAGPEITWSRMQPNGVSQADHYDSFYAKIVEGSNQIFGATRRCRANWMVCGLNVASVLQVMRNFDASEDTTAIGPHFIGTIGQIRVYVNPNYDSNVFVLGYKGPNLMDAGYAYCPYMPITTTGMVTLDDYQSREGWATTYGTKLINPRLYVKGRIL